jgi:type II secretory pathway component PulC
MLHGLDALAITNVKGAIRIQSLLRQCQSALASARYRGAAPWPRIAVVILSLAILAQLLHFTLTMRQFTRRLSHSLAAVSGAPPTSSAIRGARVSSQAEALDRLLAAHLFGARASGSDAEPAEAPAQWVLSGVIYGPTPQTGLAIMGENAQSTHLRSIGQDVGAGYRLTQVLTDRVTIEGHGERLSLRLPRNRAADTRFASAAGAAAEDRPASMPKLPPGIWHPAKGSIGVKLPAEALFNPQPHRDSDGGYAGIEVTGADATLLHFGLQRADVITQIDGHAITSAKAAQQALKQLSSGSAVMVTVERAGAPMTLPITISEDGS